MAPTMSHRRNYTEEIDEWIMNYVKTFQSEFTLGGNQYWIEASESMAKAKNLDKYDRVRTWQSLKDHFRRVILPQMKSEDEEDQDTSNTMKKKKSKAGRLSLTSAYELGAPESKGSPLKVNPRTPRLRQSTRNTPRTKKVESPTQEEDDENDDNSQTESDADSMNTDIRNGTEKETGVVAESQEPEDIEEAIFSGDEDQEAANSTLSSPTTQAGAVNNLPTQAQVHQELFQMLLVTVLAILAFLMFNDGEPIRVFDKSTL
eukprot:m.40547 g.40547  ORF g.40547 m.40547 type:complete len:260 (-) comp14827_c0_seq1:246-1025(-)